MKKGILALCAAFVLPTTAFAALNDVGSGLINDTTLNITWLKDANLVKTSCDANNSLWQAFDPTAVANNSGRSKIDICTDSGVLNWYEAEAWIGILNAQNYSGYNDWRQPATVQPDLTCSLTDTGGQNRGFRCTGSELGHLFNVSLGNPNSLDDSCSHSCLTNTGPFNNMQSSSYWSGTDYAPGSPIAWLFHTSAGFQDQFLKNFANLFVWPVRSGQVAVAPTGTAQAVPVPVLSGFGLAALSFLLAGLAGRFIQHK
ncbi:Lcl domain-containing protein [Vibrio alginolyticus]|uniref:Lcl domain-containing protein n=1 Tax=Vibrio alginolyticus TaxID=663 RepID=UPI0037543B79